MKPTALLSISTVLLIGSISSAFAQERIYRCSGKGDTAPEYINNAKVAQARGCKPIEGGNVTVVQSYARPAAETSALQELMHRLLAAQFPVLTWWAMLTILTRQSMPAPLR